MSPETEAFRAELKAAGQPWQQRGVKVVAAGFVVLIGAQIFSSFALLLLYAAITLIGVGWSFLILAFVRRRRWVKARVDLTLPDLPDLP
jgi:uncharacterized membrane protein HdeD (DUF308 family)